MMIDKWLGIAALCFIAILAVVLPSSADEVLLSTLQPFCLKEGTTLVVVDVDPQQGMVWLEVYRQNETLSSAVLGLGEHLNCTEIDIAVNRIYAGGEGDLVSLEINGERNTSRIPLGSPEVSL